MRRRGDDGPYVDVLADTDTVDGTGAGTPPGAGRTHGGRRSWPVAVAGVLVLGVVGALGGPGEQQALRRYAEVDGVVAPMAGPPTVTWRLPAVQRAWAVAGLVVTTEEPPGVVAREAVTGEVRWSLPLPEGTPRELVGCPWEARDGDTAVVVCWMPRGPGPGTVLAEWGLHVVDAADGSTRGEMSRPVTMLGAAAVDGDVVVVERSHDGVVVTRHDVVAGARRWRTHLDDLERGTGVHVHGTEDVVVLEGPTTAVLAADDGRELGRWDAVTGSAVVETARVLTYRGVGFAVWPSPSAGRWYAVDGTPGPELAGRPADPAVHDLGTPGVVLLTSADGERLRAVDVTTGEVVWERTAPGRLLLRLDGRVVAAGDGYLRALDAATGEDLWLVRLDSTTTPALGPPLTDGVRVVVPGRRDDGALTLTAYAVTSGDLQWNATLARDDRYLAVLGRQLTAVGRAPDGSAAEVLRVLG